MTQNAQAPFLRLAVEAMKCRFELVLVGDEPARLRAVGEEALEEIEGLGRKLNFYSPSSLLSRLNRDASAAAVPVDARLYELLALCRHVHSRTGGAFDPTIAPLLEAWGFLRRRGRRPSDSELGDALKRVGFDKVLLNDEKRTLRLTGGVTLNLSSIAKGYALDCAAEILREHGVRNALLHGGASSVLALGYPPKQAGSSPQASRSPESPRKAGDAGWVVEVEDPRENHRCLVRWTLRDQAMSVSGNHLNVLRVTEKALPDPDALPDSNSSDREAPWPTIGHVIDPRTGRPVERILAASVAIDCANPLPAARADAYATAALVDPAEDPPWQKEVKRLHRATT